MRGKYLRPSELLKQQRETGKSYWDLIGRPLYDEGKDEQQEDPEMRRALEASTRMMLNQALELPLYAGGKDGGEKEPARYQYTMDKEAFRAEPYLDKLGVKTSGYGFTKNMETVKDAQLRKWTEPEARAALEKEMDHRITRTMGYIDPMIREVIQNDPTALAMLADAVWQAPYGYGGKHAALVKALNNVDLYNSNPKQFWNRVASEFNRGNSVTSVAVRNKDRAAAFRALYRPEVPKKLRPVTDEQIPMPSASVYFTKTTQKNTTPPAQKVPQDFITPIDTSSYFQDSMPHVLSNMIDTYNEIIRGGQLQQPLLQR